MLFYQDFYHVFRIFAVFPVFSLLFQDFTRFSGDMRACLPPHAEYNPNNISTINLGNYPILNSYIYSSSVKAGISRPGISGHQLDQLLTGTPRPCGPMGAQALKWSSMPWALGTKKAPMYLRNIPNAWVTRTNGSSGA